MSAGQPWGEATPDGSGPEINLASMLNILWRRRIFVIGVPLLGMIAGLLYGFLVTPLYEAQAIIRPGITAFGTNGGGNREWKLKDLSRWYGDRLYRPNVARALGIEIWEVPRIKSDFVMRGLQTTEGGNVLSLSLLDPDPERAREILDTSISAFASFVLVDSTSNALVLSERGLEIQIADREREKVAVGNDLRRVNLDIEMAYRDSLQIDRRQAVIQAEIDKGKARRTRIEADIATHELRMERLHARLAEIDEAVADAHALLAEGARSDTMNSSVKASAQMTSTEAYRGLLDSQLDLSDRLQGTTKELDVLRQNLVEEELDLERKALDRDMGIEKQRRDAGRNLAELELQRDSGIALQLEQLELQIREREVQIAALSPIERVGPITASPKPVRPRKSRAIGILTFAGLLGGIALAFVWEYGWNHRREIFSDQPI